MATPPWHEPNHSIEKSDLVWPVAYLLSSALHDNVAFMPVSKPNFSGHFVIQFIG